MSVFEEILDNLNISEEIYKVLGLPDPSLNPVIPGEEKQPLGSPAMVWLKANQVFVVLALILLVILLFATKRRRG